MNSYLIEYQKVGVQTCKISNTKYMYTEDNVHSVKKNILQNVSFLYAFQHFKDKNIKTCF